MLRSLACRVRRVPARGGGPLSEDPAVIPMIAYENGPAAMDWLARAFGFREKARMTAADGRLSHGEMEAGEGLIMLATTSPHYQGPRRQRDECGSGQRWAEGA